MVNKSDKDASVLGTVTEALPNTLFRVRLEGQAGSKTESPAAEQDSEILAYLAGKMRMNRIRVLIGDRVMVEIDPYGGKGRIVKRL